MQDTSIVDHKDSEVQNLTLRTQVSHRFSQIPGLIFMSALALFTVLPQIGFAGFALASPETRSIIVNDPMIAIELALAAAFWALLVVWPLCRLLGAVFCERHVEIADGVVKVVDQSPFSRTLWSLPVWSYDGVAHHVRSTLSGVHHEAVMVHVDRRRNIILASAPTLGQAEIREFCRLLLLPEVPAGRVYGFGGPSSADHKDTPARRVVTA